MKTLALPLIALGIAAHSYADEPAASQMRIAFAARLAADVQGALAFVAETGGAAAVDQVRAAGTDRFEIRSFRKLDCARMDEGRGYVCGFVVDVNVVNGTLHRTLSGYFLPGPSGPIFKHEA
jgi:hypothetical protein